jgi:hypothetical protein
MVGRNASLRVAVAVLLLVAGTAIAQSIISARSGMVHHVEGLAAIDGQAIDVKYSQFPEVRVGQVLKTEDGRVEVLLNPGVFLRVAENSSFRMVSNQLTDTRIELLSGTSMVEYGEVAKEHHLTLLYKDGTVVFDKAGLYRVDAATGALRVYQGEAKVTRGDQTLSAKVGREVMMAAPVLTSMKFDLKEDDEFYRWASRRAGYLALANVSAAKSLKDSGFSGSGLVGSGTWRWSPYFGMYTYIPYNSMYYSPFGYSFYSPYLISGFYNAYPGYYNNGAYYGGGGGGGTSQAAAATRGSVNYAAPSRPGVSSGTGGGMMRGDATGGFGGMGHSGGMRGGYDNSGSGWNGGYSGSSGSVSSSSTSVASPSSGSSSAVSAPSAGASHGGSAGGHGR